MDGTFFVVREPFKQLFTISVFLKKNGFLKQVPVAFALMSGKEIQDYTAVLTELKNCFGDVPPRVKEMVFDFEKAMWRSCEDIFPHASLHGCLFHWKQAIWKRIQKLSLSTAYRNIKMVRDCLQRIMCLPFLPYQVIEKNFERIIRELLPPLQKEHPEQAKKIEELINYVRNTWLKDKTWVPKRWSVYGRKIRTNNDAEGFHNRLKIRAKGGKLNFYKLLRLLHSEARKTLMQKHLLQQGKNPTARPAASNTNPSSPAAGPSCVPEKDSLSEDGLLKSNIRFRRFWRQYSTSKTTPGLERVSSWRMLEQCSDAYTCDDATPVEKELPDKTPIVQEIVE